MIKNNIIGDALYYLFNVNVMVSGLVLLIFSRQINGNIYFNFVFNSFLYV